MGSRAGLDGCGRSCPYRNSILGSSSLPPNARFREILFLLYCASSSLFCTFSYYVPYYVLLFFCIFRVIPFFASNVLIILCLTIFITAVRHLQSLLARFPLDLQV